MGTSDRLSPRSLSSKSGGGTEDTLTLASPHRLCSVPNVPHRFYLSQLHHLLDMAETQTTVRVRHEDAQLFVTNLLVAAGVSGPNASITARGLVEADLRGVESHGINRIPSYLKRIRHGVLHPGAEPTLTQVTPVVAQVQLHSFPAATLRY